MPGEARGNSQRHIHPLTNGEYTTSPDQYHHPHQHHRGRRYENRVAGVQMFAFFLQFSSSLLLAALYKKSVSVGNEKGVVGRFALLVPGLFTEGWRMGPAYLIYALEIFDGCHSTPDASVLSGWWLYGYVHNSDEPRSYMPPQEHVTKFETFKPPRYLSCCVRMPCEERST